ncbi:Alpha-ketoglutarate-dependent dioxygenase FTO, partial [Dissostichus eleginoides]
MYWSARALRSVTPASGAAGDFKRSTCLSISSALLSQPSLARRERRGEGQSGGLSPLVLRSVLDTACGTQAWRTPLVLPRRRLLQELGNQKIPFLGPPDRGYQQLWDSSYSGLVLRRSCSVPAELHVRVQAALLTLRRKGCLLRDLVRIRERDVFTAVSRTLLGEPGHTYRYLDTRLFAIPWHSEDPEVKGQNCCDSDLSAACKALWELNTFFSSDVSQRKEGDRLTQCLKEEVEAKLSDEGDTGSKNSEDSKNSEGGDSESKQSEEGETESKHSEDWDIESKHSEEGCSGSKQEGEWETKSKHSSEEGESSEDKPSGVSASEHNEGKWPSLAPKALSGTQNKGVGIEVQGKPVAKMKHISSDHHVEDREEAASRQGCSQPSPPPVCTGPVKFNVTLLNYMDPAAMSQLKEEPYYGMGKMAVGWHHDENLISHSPVAVYSYNCHNDKGESSEGGSEERPCWRIGLKVAWDIHTPGLTLPLESGDCYYMRDDLNSTHQHCVLAGESARFSSTHRVAECSSGTLTYIQSRCGEALSNLRTDLETGSHSLLALLPTTLKHCEEIHNEVAEGVVEHSIATRPPWVCDRVPSGTPSNDASPPTVNIGGRDKVFPHVLAEKAWWHQSSWLMCEEARK